MKLILIEMLVFKLWSLWNNIRSFWFSVQKPIIFLLIIIEVFFFLFFHQSFLLRCIVVSQDDIYDIEQLLPLLKRTFFNQTVCFVGAYFPNTLFLVYVCPSQICICILYYVINAEYKRTMINVWVVEKKKLTGSPKWSGDIL